MVYNSIDKSKQMYSISELEKTKEKKSYSRKGSVTQEKMVIPKQIISPPVFINPKPIRTSSQNASKRSAYVNTPNIQTKSA